MTTRELVMRFLLLGLAWLGGHAAALEPEAAHRIPRLGVTLFDLEGVPHDLRDDAAGRVRAIVFLSTECPIANGSLPALAALHHRFAADEVEILGVVSDATVSRRRAAEHFAGFNVPFPVLFDGSGLLRETLGPTHVPEAFVLDRAANPSSPPRRVTWGDGTTDEMMYCFFLLSARRTEDLIRVVLDNLSHDARQPRVN